MTESLMQKFEEKLMLVLARVEDLEKEIKHLSNENASLKVEREVHAKKLVDLLSLLDSVSIVETLNNANMVSMKQQSILA